MSDFKTKVILWGDCGRLEYYSPEEASGVIYRLANKEVAYLQTKDCHCVIVNPRRIGAMEVRSIG